MYSKLRFEGSSGGVGDRCGAMGSYRYGYSDGYRGGHGYSRGYGGDTRAFGGIYHSGFTAYDSVLPFAYATHMYGRSSTYASASASVHAFVGGGSP